MRNSLSARKLLWFGSVVILVLAGIALGAWYWKSLSHAQTPAVPDTSIHAGSYQLHFNIEPDTPQVGVNKLTLEVRDGNRRNVVHARVEIGASMAAMGTMPAMHVPAEVHEAEPGIYRGTLDLPMSGEWPLTISIDTPSLGHAETVLEMATGRQVVASASTIPPVAAAAPRCCSAWFQYCGAPAPAPT